MSRLQARALHLSSALVALSGLVYGWMRYFAGGDDPFAVVGHPWQPHLQHAHVLAAPLLVFCVGLVWVDHVWARLRSPLAGRRRSGWSLVLTLAPMITSGYLVQVTVDERWRTAWVWTHVATSLAWCAFYLVHQVARRRRPAPAPR